MLRDVVLSEFKDVYKRVVGKDPFTDDASRDIDIINVLNFGLIEGTQPSVVAREGLVSVLRKRFNLYSR